MLALVKTHVAERAEWAFRQVGSVGASIDAALRWGDTVRWMIVLADETIELPALSTAHSHAFRRAMRGALSGRAPKAVTIFGRGAKRCTRLPKGSIRQYSRYRSGGLSGAASAWGSNRGRISLRASPAGRHALR